MNDDELWAAIDGQRRRTVALLQSLTPDEWKHPRCARAGRSGMWPRT
jgi:hypothetical protein